jgi:hypothetical protein
MRATGLGRRAGGGSGTFDVLDGAGEVMRPSDFGMRCSASRVMREVVFLHRASRTLVATDLVENFQDETPGTNAILRTWIRLFRMWGRPRPAGPRFRRVAGRRLLLDEVLLEESPRRLYRR